MLIRLNTLSFVFEKDKLQNLNKVIMKSAKNIEFMWTDSDSAHENKEKNGPVCQNIT